MLSQIRPRHGTRFVLGPDRVALTRARASGAFARDVEWPIETRSNLQLCRRVRSSTPTPLSVSNRLAGSGVGVGASSTRPRISCDVESNGGATPVCEPWKRKDPVVMKLAISAGLRGSAVVVRLSGLPPD